MRRQIFVTVSVLILAIICIQFQADGAEYFSFEAGPVTGNTGERKTLSELDPLSVTQLGYMRTKENNTFIHFFWGSLVSEYSQRTQYIFGEIGYKFKLKDPWTLELSFGIGRVDLTDRYLSTNNMFTEAIRLSYGNFYLCKRHMSNGEEFLSNSGKNYGRNTLTLGYKF